jgi:hypothetical protein
MILKRDTVSNTKRYRKNSGKGDRGGPDSSLVFVFSDWAGHRQRRWGNVESGMVWSEPQK